MKYSDLTYEANKFSTLATEAMQDPAWDNEAVKVLKHLSKYSKCKIYTDNQLDKISGIVVFENPRHIIIGNAKQRYAFHVKKEDVILNDDRQVNENDYITVIYINVGDGQKKPFVMRSVNKG